MNKQQIEKHQKLIDKADDMLDGLTYEEQEILYKMCSETEDRLDKIESQLSTTDKKHQKLKKEFKKLANEVDDAIIELQVEHFLTTNEIGDAQDVEYN